MFALAAVCSGLAIWIARKTIGTAVIDRKLAAAHVRARYRIVDLGLGRQRLTNVIIGDPAAPDLTADWIELRTRFGLDGASITAVSARGLRVRASVVNGRLSLGEVDRLLPTANSAGAFHFPGIHLRVKDARAQVTSAFGVTEVALSGIGRLDDGFRGRATATNARVVAGACSAWNAVLASSIRIDRGAVTLAGPIGAKRISCQGEAVERPIASVRLTLAKGLTAWRGSAALRADRIVASSAAVSGVQGRIGLAGSAGSTTGDLTLTGGPAHLWEITARGVAVRGRYRFDADAGFAGTIQAAGATAPAKRVATLLAQQVAGADTPIAPLVAKGSAALARALSNVDVRGQVEIHGNGVSVTGLDAVARSGARASFIAEDPIRIVSGGVAAIAGTGRLSGGGLPEATVRLAQSKSDATMQGVALIKPYVAGGARLALKPVRFAWNGKRGRLATVATLSGPLSKGRIEDLRVPIAAEWNRSGAVSLDPGCTTTSFDRLAVASVSLKATRIEICATGPALIEIRGNRVDGAARIPALRLEGTLGATPLLLTAKETRITMVGRRAEAHDVAAELGKGSAATRLDIEQLTGAVDAGGIAGRFDNAAGQIGQVPMLLSDGGGSWTFAHGALTLAATATVTDANPAARFRPLRADTVRLRLASGAIKATTTLVTPDRAVPVARVMIAHNFVRGLGEAVLAVPALAFTEAFQPDALTPLTFGVIADVRGTATGEARIAWNSQHVTSTGTFRTDGLDLAAAFGPVRGLAGTVNFSDLLRLESAPSQIATVASLNPGILVQDGRIVYRLLPDARIEIESGHWPFAGGSLDLQPTTLTFSEPNERRLTFALDGVDAGRFLQQFNFGNLSATGTFDGALPMIFDTNGGRIEGGELRARRGGGNIAYLGELTKEDLGTWGNVAFQALRSIDYRDLGIVMNGPLAGEMITEVRFAGISQGKGARSNLLIRRLQKLALVFNIRIQAPFRGLIDSAQSFYDPSRLISRNLPALLRQQNEAARSPGAIQPEASDPQP